MSENSKIKEIYIKLKDFQDETHFLIYLGTGLCQIAGGLLFTLLVSFLLGLPIIMIYPYLNATLLWIIKLIGWIYIIIGVITMFIPFFKIRYDDSKTVKIITIISIIISILIFPIGPFLALGLKQELKSTESVERKGRNLQLPYFILLIFSGIIHFLIGLLFILIVPDFLEDQLLLLYPYINLRLINLLTIYGYINLIPGFLLCIYSFTSIKFGKIASLETQKLTWKVFRLFIILSSIILLLSFPFGTFFGLLII
ncbi:MAG: hypothetical protein ACFFB0_03855 [Promethearchaeota archaeon]